MVSSGAWTLDLGEGWSSRSTRSAPRTLGPDAVRRERRVAKFCTADMCRKPRTESFPKALDDEQRAVLRDGCARLAD